MIVLLALAGLLFYTRHRFPRVYAFLEIVIGMTMAWDALAFVQGVPVPDLQTSTYWAEKIFSPNALRIMAAAYVMVRGLVTWDEKSNYPLLPRRNPRKSEPAFLTAARQAASGKRKRRKLRES